MGVYVVTGGSGGIGGKTVEILREQGHEVINVDLKDSDICANLATKEGRDEVIQKIHELHPEGIDGLCCNAGVSGACGNVKLMVSLNYFGATNLAHGLFDLLKKKGGSCVVTSSNTICAGACTGLGIGPNRIGEVYGIMKAYCTRVGAGPFPTELFDATGDTIRQLGHEYGAVTGRERRCGWIDLVALRYSIMVNGVTKLIMMKSDVLDGFDTIKACVAYKQNGKEINYFPYNIEEGIEPVYKELPGWKTDMTQFTSEDQFPKEFNDYIKFLEAELETPICIISIGPDRAQTIERK